MSGYENIEMLGDLEGVKEATLCQLSGTITASSSRQPSLHFLVPELAAMLDTIEGNVSDLRSPLSLTVESENGALHLAKSAQAMLILATTNDANLGAVKLEMREALSAQDR